MHEIIYILSTWNPELWHLVIKRDGQNYLKVMRKKNNLSIVNKMECNFDTTPKNAGRKPYLFWTIWKFNYNYVADIFVWTFVTYTSYGNSILNISWHIMSVNQEVKRENISKVLLFWLFSSLSSIYMCCYSAMHSYLKVFFNSFPFLPSKWTERGCKVKLSDQQKTVCLCNHLTNFAILMRPYSTVRTVNYYAFLYQKDMIASPLLCIC